MHVICFLTRKKYPLLIYGCESWVSMDHLKKKFQPYDMSVLRMMEVVKRIDKSMSEIIRNRLNINSVPDKMET